MTFKKSQWPVHADEEIEAVTQVLRSGRTNYWTGTQCREFEKEYAAFVGTTYAIALMNGTVALEAALYALDIGENDEVITTCRTFIASASSIVMRGAIPVLADVDPVSQNITAETIAACITEKTKAIIVVHLAGWPADMPAIMELAKQHHLKVIEDCAQAHGAAIHGKQVGAWGDIGAFSFCQDKIITTGGEGGLVTTNDKALWQKMWAYKDHGKSYDKVYHQSHPPGFRWLHDSFGTNWRMTETQAAIGRIQLKKLPEWLQTRKDFAAILNTQFSTHPALQVTIPPAHIQHAYYKYYVLVRPETLKTGWNRDRIMNEVNAAGVTCLVGSCRDIALETAFGESESHVSLVRPHAKKLGETCLMFLVDPSMSAESMYDAADTLISVMNQATGLEHGCENALVNF